MKIPTAALDNFLFAVEEAAALALEGDRAGGYECLLVGRQRALEAGQWEEAVAPVPRSRGAPHARP